MSSPGWVPFLNQACAALHLNQRQLGENLGVSRRTVSRWMAVQSTPTMDTLADLVKHVHGVDPALASRLAVAIGQTLEGLGLATPPAASGAAAPSPPPRATSVADLLDCVVCSVAEAADLSPKTVRPMVMLAFRRAHELGLDLAAVSKASAPPSSGD